MTETRLDRDERRALSAALVDVAPWLERTDAGPRAVDPGQCDRCEQRPRLLPTCGPVAWRALCRACAGEVGTEAWCDGHAGAAGDLLAWADDLPPWWGDAVVLWWVATGEVAALPATTHPGLPAAVSAELTRSG